MPAPHFPPTSPTLTDPFSMFAASLHLHSRLLFHHQIFRFVESGATIGENHLNCWPVLTPSKMTNVVLLFANIEARHASLLSPKSIMLFRCTTVFRLRHSCKSHTIMCFSIDASNWCIALLQSICKVLDMPPLSLGSFSKRAVLQELQSIPCAATSPTRFSQSMPISLQPPTKLYCICPKNQKTLGYHAGRDPLLLPRRADQLSACRANQC